MGPVFKMLKVRGSKVVVRLSNASFIAEFGMFHGLFWIFCDVVCAEMIIVVFCCWKAEAF